MSEQALVESKYRKLVVGRQPEFEIARENGG
jgi:hypothetical protein